MHVNTHLDFANAVQIAQVSKMLELIDEVGFDGVTFVTGDFNMTPSAGAYQLMLEAGFENTFNVANIKSELKIDSMIDFCFIRNGNADSNVETHHVANDAADKVYNEIFPSDRCAVMATVVPVIKEN
jgi:endonuclease/exonuclease/phosphatase family metal-dependent hydrolase